MSRKNGTEGKIRSQMLDHWAGVGRECRAWMAGRAWMGAGQGRAGPVVGDVRVPMIKTCVGIG